MCEHRRRAAFRRNARCQRKPEDRRLVIPGLVERYIMAWPQRVPRNGECPGALQSKRQPHVGSASRYIAKESSMCNADHNKCAAVENKVLAHGLLRGAERVARKIEAK